MSKENSKQTVQTTGHAWDGDLQEFNNPLPNWWLWSFYATVIFAVIYWVFYPAWPVGKNYTKGVMNDVTYTTSEGKTVTTHWNTRAVLMQDLQAAREMQKPYLDQISKASYAEIKKDQEKTAFAYSMAKVLFADNCAACHQSGGAGVVGLYPTLADDDWLWGGKFENIEQTIREGRKGMMPAFGKRLSEGEINDLAEHVLSLSGHSVNKTSALRGKAMFEGSAGCVSCHGVDAKGQTSMGSANLTDSIWTIANVPAQKTIEGQKAEVMKVIRNGVSREMPSWKGRLNNTEIKMLTFYVHELSGGK